MLALAVAVSSQRPGHCYTTCQFEEAARYDHIFCDLLTRWNLLHSPLPKAADTVVKTSGLSGVRNDRVAKRVGEIETNSIDTER